MKVNYVLMYGTPYLKYREFDTFEDISKFLVNKRIVNYSIFKKLEDKEEVEMIYRDSDIHYLEKENKRLNNIINEIEKFMDEDYEYYKKYGSAEQGHAMGQISRFRNKMKELKRGNE